MASNPFQQGVPGPNIVNKDGGLTGPWFAFFVSLWERTGGASGSIGFALNTISTTAGATLYQAGPQWEALNPGAQYTVMQMGVEFPNWNFLTGSNFGAQSANVVLAGPVSGPALNPTFRALQSADLSTLAVRYIMVGAVNDIRSVGTPRTCCAPAAIVPVSSTYAPLFGGPGSDADIWLIHAATSVCVVDAAGPLTKFPHTSQSPGDKVIDAMFVGVPLERPKRDTYGTWSNMYSPIFPTAALSFVAVPGYCPAMVDRSADCKALNVGLSAGPLTGPAKITFAL